MQALETTVNSSIMSPEEKILANVENSLNFCDSDMFNRREKSLIYSTQAQSFIYLFIYLHFIFLSFLT
jgi:hypothetical protein